MSVTYHCRNDLLRLVDESHDGSSMANASDTFDSGIEGSLGLHVRDDDRLESTFAVFGAEDFVEPLALVFRADCATHVEAIFERSVDNVAGDEAIGSSDKNQRAFGEVGCISSHVDWW
jgi:hypothetical protein